MSDDGLQSDADSCLNVMKGKLEEADDKTKSEWHWYCRCFLPKAGHCSKSKWISKRDPSDGRTFTKDAFTLHDKAFGLTIVKQEQEELMKKVRVGMVQCNQALTGGRFEMPKELPRECGSNKESCSFQKRHGESLREGQERHFKIVDKVESA